MTPPRDCSNRIKPRAKLFWKRLAREQRRPRFWPGNCGPYCESWISLAFRQHWFRHVSDFPDPSYPPPLRDTYRGNSCPGQCSVCRIQTTKTRRREGRKQQFRPRNIRITRIDRGSARPMPSLSIEGNPKLVAKQRKSRKSSGKMAYSCALGASSRLILHSASRLPAFAVKPSGAG